MGVRTPKDSLQSLPLEVESVLQKEVRNGLLHHHKSTTLKVVLVVADMVDRRGVMAFLEV